MSRCASDSDDSSDLDMEPLVRLVSHDEKPCPRLRSSSDPDGRKRKPRDRRGIRDGKEKGDKKLKEEKDADTEKSPVDKNREGKNEETVRRQDAGQIQIKVTHNDSEGQAGQEVQAAEEQPSVSEASDSCQTDSRVITSPSSDSLDALEEDDLVTCSSSSIHLNTSSRSFQLHPYSQRHVQSHLLIPPPAHCHPLINFTTLERDGGTCRRSGDGADPQLLQNCSDNLCSDDNSLCFADLSRLVDFLPSPPEASEEDDDEEDELRRRRKMLKEMDGEMCREGEAESRDGVLKEHPLSNSPSSTSHIDFVFNFDQSDARCYYNLCSNITPDSARSLSHHQHHNEEEEWLEMEEDESKADDQDPIPILHPPPGFGDSSSDEEFFDARDRFTSPEDPSSGAVPRGDLVFTLRLMTRFFCHFQALSNSDPKIKLAFAAI